ncbi:MAG: murein biosynthesis integral membrane protein MurJ [Desulfobulbus propionicus]|nr:MAG: murein biosynthesis integral membrane protein MurJ [Desulfobulbus propionicus]
MTENTETHSGKIARSAGSVSVAVMCSRVLGLAREQIFAALFGAGFAYDAFIVAFRIPNLLRDLFGEGALSAAFVTVFSDYDANKGERATWRLASTVLVFLAMLISFLTLVGIYWAEDIVNLLAPEFHFYAGKTELTTQLTQIMLPFLFFVSMSAVVMGMLNTKGHFFVPALSSSFFNLGSIIGGVSMAWILPRFGYPAIMGMAWGTLLGGALQLMMQLPTLRLAGFRFITRLNFHEPGLKKIMVLMLPATIGLSATQINIFVNTNFAASCAQGSVSWLNYAFRLVQLPIGLFGVAFAIAATPVLARHAATKDISGLRQTFTSSLVMVFSLTIPASVALILLGSPIIRLIFEHGAFTATDTLRTAEALSCYATGLFAYSAIKVLVPTFYAIGKTRYPVIGSFLAVGANILIISSTIDVLQHRAIALSTSAVMALNFFFLAVVLYRQLQGYPLRELLLGLVKICFATLVMAAVLTGLLTVLDDWLQGMIIMQFLAVLLLVTGGGAVYALALYLARLPEFIRLYQQVASRFNRPA